MNEIERLTTDYVSAVQEYDFGLALVLIDSSTERSTTALNVRNVSEAAVCAGVLLSAILRDGPPACPHCLNNYRRVEKALRVMKEHPAAPGAHQLH